MWTKALLYALTWSIRFCLRNAATHWVSAILSLMFFRTQNSPRRWRRGRHPSQRWTRLIDSEPNKHMLRWNIFWWCFLLLGLQNLFTPIRYYCISCEEHLLKGMKTQCIGWGEWSWVFSNLPFVYLDPLVWSTPLACPWDPHAESDVIKSVPQKLHRQKLMRWFRIGESLSRCHSLILQRSKHGVTH